MIGAAAAVCLVVYRRNNHVYRLAGHPKIVAAVDVGLLDGVLDLFRQVGSLLTKLRIVVERHVSHCPD